jgi:LysM repeat protein
MHRLRLCFLCGLIVAMLCAPSPAGATAPRSDRDRVRTQEQVVHVVQPGENLFRISLRYGTTVDAIVAANGLSGHTVYVGQRLLIPSDSGASAGGSRATANSTYVVRRGDTVSGIALRHGVTTWALLEANGLSSSHLIYVGQRLVIPGAWENVTAPAAAPGSPYVVRRGDTLSGIAQRFGTTVDALARLNGVASPSTITVGQVLRVSGTTQAPHVAPSSSGKRILIDLSEQHLYAYQGDQLVHSSVISSGAAPSYTRTGEFRVQSKIPKAYGASWGIWMPYWLGIYWAGSTENGIHALPVTSGGQTLWASYLGRPVSYGCVVMGTQDAKRLYDWADIGTPVSIRN